MIKFGVLKSVLLSEAKAVLALSGSPYPVSDMRYVLDELKGLTACTKDSTNRYRTYVVIRKNGTESAGTSEEAFKKCAAHNDTTIKAFEVVAVGGQFTFRCMGINNSVEW